MASDRLPMIPADQLTDEQRRAVAAFTAGRQTPVFGPFTALLRSPEVMLRAQAMGDHFRFHSSLPQALTEFTILVTARQWTQRFQWSYHCPLALAAGIRPETVTSLAAGMRPEPMTDDEALVYDFCTELERHHTVSDALYTRATARFGERGLIDLVGTVGYYTFQAMVLNTARAAGPEGSAPDLPSLPW
jgi:4-carboxymuconolactone decarboxylase